MNKMNNEITIFCPIFAAPGKEEALWNALVSTAAETRKEAGNICYRLHQVNGKSGEFMIYEQWRDQAALDYHMSQPYLKELLADREHLLKDEIHGIIATESK